MLDSVELWVGGPGTSTSSLSVIFTVGLSVFGCSDGFGLGQTLSVFDALCTYFLTLS